MRQCLEKERLLKLTLAVYKVTAIFPVGKEGDHLGSKIRDLADKILAENGSVEEMTALLDAVEAKNWIDPRNFLVLRREYAGYLNSAEPSLNLAQPSLNHHRQEKIVAVMNGNGAVKIGDLVRLFPGVNRRTVLRDLDTLCHSGVMVRNGSGRGVYYAKNGSSTSP